MRPAGYYWVRGAWGDPFIAEWGDDERWQVTGSEERHDDATFAVLSPRLELVIEANRKRYLVKKSSQLISDIPQGCLGVCVAMSHELADAMALSPGGVHVELVGEAAAPRKVAGPFKTLIGDE